MAVIQIGDFSGSINQNFSNELLKLNQSPLMLNVSQDEVGDVGHRLGITQLGNTINANPIQGLGVYRATTGVEYLVAGCNGSLYTYNTGTSTWDLVIGSGLYSLTSKLEFTNSLNQLIVASDTATEYLEVLNATASSVAGQVGYTVEGKYITTINNRTYIGGSTAYPNRINYTDPLTTGGGRVFTLYGTADASSSGTTLKSAVNLFRLDHVGKIVYNLTKQTRAQITVFTDSKTVTVDTTIGDTWDGDSIRVGENFIDLDEPVTGLCSLGQGSPVLAFDKNNAYVIDGDTGYRRKMEGYGCTSNRSIAVVLGNAIWLGRGGFYRMAANEAYPTKISKLVENEISYDAAFNKISGSGFSNAAAVVSKNKYFCSVGDLTGEVDGVTITNCMFVFDLALQSWSLRSYDSGDFASCLTEWVDQNGVRRVVMGSRTSGIVAILDDPTTITDLGTNVDAFFRTKHFTFGKQPYLQKQILGGYLKYSVEDGDSAGGDFNINYSADGNKAYSLWTSPPTTDPSLKYEVGRMQPFANPKFKSVSIEFQGSRKWDIHDLKLDMEQTRSPELRVI